MRNDGRARAEEEDLHCVSCSPVLREEQYEYCQSAARAGCMESRMVRKAPRANSVDRSLFSMVARKSSSVGGLARSLSCELA